jgi:hypothetical protein
MRQLVSLATAPFYPASVALLDPAERVFLVAVRGWVSGYRGDEDPVPRLCRGLKIAGARDAAFSINEFMAVIANTAREQIAIHRPRSRDISGDERQLIFAASLAQADESAAAERVLRESLISATGAEFALDPLRLTAELFARAGLNFSRRRPHLEKWSHHDTDAIDYSSRSTRTMQ